LFLYIFTSKIHFIGPRTIARIAKECGVERMIHVSALNATEKPEPLMLKEGSKFLSAKWRGLCLKLFIFLLFFRNTEKSFSN
jgi:hypothetical protein